MWHQTFVARKNEKTSGLRKKFQNDESSIREYVQYHFNLFARCMNEIADIEEKLLLKSS